MKIAFVIIGIGVVLVGYVIYRLLSSPSENVQVPSAPDPQPATLDQPPPTPLAKTSPAVAATERAEPISDNTESAAIAGLAVAGAVVETVLDEDGVDIAADAVGSIFDLFT